MVAVPRVGAGGAQRAARLALVAGVADVVVGLVDLLGTRQRVARGPVLRPEPADVHLPDVERRLAGDDPLRHHLADPAGPGQPVGAEPGGHEQPTDIGLAEAELVVGGERLGAVDQPRDLDVLHRGHALGRVAGDLLEPRPVLLQQAAVEVRGDTVAQALVEKPRGAVSLVAAHDQSRPLLAEVDEVVRVAQRRQVIVGGALAERLGDQVLVREGDDGHAHPGHAADLGRVHAARVDDDLGLDVAPFGRDAAHPPLGDHNVVDARVGEHLAAPAARAVDERVGEQRRIQVTVGGQVGGAAHPVGHH